MSLAHDKYVASQQKRNALPIDINPDTSALIIIDMQEYFINPASHFSQTLAHRMPGLCDHMQERARTVVEPAFQRLLDCFRARGLTTFSAFMSTGLERTWRHLGMEDACATFSPECHEAALLNFQGFGRVRSADEVIALLENARSA